jgi:hypothetical protein
MRLLALLFFMLIVVTAQPAVAQTDWSVVKTFHIGEQGGWDYLTVDPQSHRLYVPRGTHTMVIDGASGSVVGDIQGQQNAHGVAIAPKAGRGFISDGGGSGAIVIFDLKTNAKLGTIAAMPDADGIIYDPSSNLVLVVSGRGKALMTLKPDVDPTTATIGTPIELRGEPEFLAADGKGRVYINLMTTNDVAVVDLKARKVINNWSVAPGGQPVGMAIDGARGRLFIGCRGPQKLIVMSTVDGKILADLPIGAGVDAVKFDRNRAFASTADGNLSIAAEAAPGRFQIVQTVKTAEGARTMGLDPATQRIYLPSAEFETGPNGRRRATAETFMILVVSAISPRPVQ